MGCNKVNKCKFSDFVNRFISCIECPYYDKIDNVYDFQGCFEAKNVIITNKHLTIKQDNLFEVANVTIFFDDSMKITFDFVNGLLQLHIIFNYHHVEFADNVINYVNANNFSLLRIKYYHYDNPYYQ